MKHHVAVVGTGYWGRNLVRVFGQLGGQFETVQFDGLFA